MAKGYLESEEIKRLKRYEMNNLKEARPYSNERFIVDEEKSKRSKENPYGRTIYKENEDYEWGIGKREDFVGSDSQYRDYVDLKKRYKKWKDAIKSFVEKKEKASAEKTEQTKKDTDPINGVRHTNLTKGQFKDGGLSYQMDTGGGEPISAGKTWPDEPDKERVEQPHAPNGQFTFNSIAGLDKKDKRDRAKGSAGEGYYGDDPALDRDSSGAKNSGDSLGQEYLERERNRREQEIKTGKKQQGQGFKKGDVVKLKDGSTVVFTHDLSLQQFYKYYMTNYKDDSGEIRNALLENGFIVRIGNKYGSKSGMVVANVNDNESGLGSKKRVKEFNDAFQQAENFMKAKGIEAREVLAEVKNKFATKHPGVPNANTPGYVSPSTPKQPKPSPTGGVSAAPKASVNAGSQSLSDSQAMNMAQSNLNMFMKNNNAALIKAASHFNMGIKDIAQMVADGDLNFSEIASL